MKKTLWYIALFSLLGLLTTPTLAQLTTGMIDGLVVDEEGEPLPGVTVVATSPSLQGERTAVTNQEGRFKMPALPAGNYKLRFSLQGFREFLLSDLLVQLGKSAAVQATMASGEFTETITVTSAMPLIETNRVDNSVNMAGTVLDTMPTQARSFRDLTKFVPGVTSVELNTTSASRVGWPSIRGEGQYGDNYLIDGLSVRDPAIKTYGTPMPFDAMEEVQIITDGFSPEYGQALGGMVNVITKSGSNTFGGEAAFIYASDATTASFEETILANPTDLQRANPYVNLGGPFVKDKLWWFLSYNRFENYDTYAPNAIRGYGTLPEGKEETNQNAYFAKLTWAITARHNLSGNYTYRDAESIGLGSADSSPEARSAQDVEDDRARLNYQGIFSPNSVLELKAGTVDRKLVTVPESGERGPAQYRLTSFAVNTNNAWRLSDDDRKRRDVAGIFTQFWDAGRSGSHEFKVGVSYHEPEQVSSDFFTGNAEVPASPTGDVFSVGVNPDGTDFGSQDTFNNGSLFQLRTGTTNTQIPTTLNEYRSEGSLSNRSEEYGIFLQDRWEVGRWNFTLGFRMDSQKAYNDVDDIFFEYDLAKTFSPRVAIAWDASGDGVNVVKAGWGRFYDTTSTRLGEFANTRESFSFRNYGWIGGMDVNGDGSIDDDDWAGINFLDHRGTGDAWDIWSMNNWAFDHEQSAESNPLDYTDLEKPNRADRFLLEYDRQIGNNYAFKTRYINNKARDLIEDVHYFYNDWRVVNSPQKLRNYHSVELEFNGNPSPNIMFRTNWVWAQSQGTNPGQFELAGFSGTSGSGNNIGVYMDRPPSNPDGWCEYYGTPECVPGSWVGDPLRDYNNDDTVDQFDRDLYIQTFFAGLGGVDGDDQWYGDLPYSVSNQVKLFGRFNIPQWRDTYVTAFLGWGSGYHTGRQGFQHLYGDYLTFSNNLWFAGYEGACTDFADCETLFGQTPSGAGFGEEHGLPRGSVVNSSFWSLDLTMGKVFKLGRRVGWELRGELFNVLNNQRTVAIQNTATLEWGEPYTRQYPRTFRLFTRISW